MTTPDVYENAEHEHQGRYRFGKDIALTLEQQRLTALASRHILIELEFRSSPHTCLRVICKFDLRIPHCVQLPHDTICPRLILINELRYGDKTMRLLTLLPSTIISLQLLSSTLLCLLVEPTNAQLHPLEPAQYQTLPSLREQAEILNAWREERLAGIPALLQNYNIDAWLVRAHFRLHFHSKTTWLSRHVHPDESTRIRRRHHLLVHQRRKAILRPSTNSRPLPHQHIHSCRPPKSHHLDRQHWRRLARTAFHPSRVQPGAHRPEHRSVYRVWRRFACRRVRRSQRGIGREVDAEDSE